MNISNLVIKQDFTGNDVAEKMSPKMDIRKPKSTEFFRVYGNCQIGPLAMFEDKLDQEIYIVAQDMLARMGNNYIPVNLVLAVNKEGDFFVWPLKLADAYGNDNRWFVSARDAAKVAENNWVRMQADMSKNRYDLTISKLDFAMPKPSQSFDNMLQMVLEGRVIDSGEHIVIKKLEGSV